MENKRIEIPAEAKAQIDVIGTKCEKTKPLVAIHCITYNHEAYLRDALEGFVMQKTDFPFVAIVHEDASPDGTAAILREYAEKYPNIILPIFEKENQFNTTLGAVMRAARNATGAKYIAYCEGDDYWTDTFKLQKQVNFLESHPDYSMCHTGFEVVDEYSEVLTDDYLADKTKKKYGEGSVSEEMMTYYKRSQERLTRYKAFMEESCNGERFWFLLVKHNYIITATCMMRTEVNNAARGYYDYGLFLTAARMGKIGYIKEVTSAYRFHPNSVMTNPTMFEQVVLKRGAYNTWGELKRVFDKSTFDGVMSRKRAKQMLVRKVFGLWFNAAEYRKEYINFVLRHPSIWLELLKYCTNRTPKIEEVFHQSEQESVMD